MVEKQTLAMVIAIYNEQENLPDLFRRLRETFERMPDIAPTVIYVNDGSDDASLRIMLEQRAEDSRFSVIGLPCHVHGSTHHRSPRDGGMTSARAECG